ncbi:MAG TPA: hypothetical protein VJN94_16515 [Candidatus Binataceae bacterium]|nr:hypothetical protein [Candidatus Binataceae bacterium]
MMLTPLDFRELGKSDLIPHAVIRKPVSYFAKQGARLVHDSDALDSFEGAAFALDGTLFALMSRPGYPPDTTTVYLTRDFGENVEKITALIRSILKALELAPDALVWERQQDPDL